MDGWRCGPPPPVDIAEDYRFDIPIASRNDDGTYELLDDGTYDVGYEEWREHLLWQYTGMARLAGADYVRGGQSRLVVLETEVPPATLDEYLYKQILGTEEVDFTGRRWEVVDLDIDAMGSERLQSARSTWEQDWEDWEVLPHESGEEWEIPLSSYTAYDCNPGGGVDTYLADDDDDRFAFSALSSPRHRRVVTLYTRDGENGGQCSGVIVGERTILTNAHCVKDGSATLPVAAVCWGGNWSGYGNGPDCIWAHVFSVTINPAYAWPNAVAKNDYALVKWAFELPTSHPQNDRFNLAGHAGPMDITTWNSTQVEAGSVAFYGFPGWYRPGVVCLQQSFAGGNDGSWTGSGITPAQMRLYFEWRTDHTHTTNTIRTNLDGSTGQSGSPLLQCQGTQCGAEIVGLVSGTNGGLTHLHGPRASRFKTWVENNL